MKIGNREIGSDHPPYVVAEISGNSGGDIDLAKQHIIAAADCGADAVKIQCYTAESITLKSDRPEFLIKDGVWQGKTLYDLYKSAETPPAMVRELFKFAQDQKIELFSSVFDWEGVDLVKDCGAKCIKISSFDVVDTPLIQYAASTGAPLIVSVGNTSRGEINDAINAFRRGGGSPQEGLALLHCISNYPASASEANLPALGPLSELGDKNHVVGFSDHTIGCGTAVAAVCFGASIIEKHFILDRFLPSADSGFSMEPSEFSALVANCKEAWQAIQPVPQSAQNRVYRQYRKSVYVVRDIAAGAGFSKDNCRILRPACGLSPSLYPTILAGVATCDLKAGTPLQSSMVSSLC